MYTVTMVRGIKKGVNQRWQVIDTESITVANLYDRYRKMYLTLRAEPSPQALYLDMDELRPAYSSYENTLEQLMIDIMNAALPTMEIEPVINTRSARFMDAFRAGYNVRPYSAMYGENVAMSDRKDVLISRTSPKANYELLHNTTLVTINGFYHKTDLKSNSGLIVYSAAESVKISNQNQIGLLTFEGVCALQTVAFTPTMIFKRDPNTPLSSMAYVDTGMDLTNKSVLFIIGGYLHFINDIVTSVGDGVFGIDFSNYPLFDRFYEMKNHVNTDSFVLSASSVNPDQVSVQELQSDDNIKALLLMSQSFMVVLDTPHLYADRYYVKSTGYPGSFIAYTYPNKSLVTGIGRHSEYWYRTEDDQHILTVYDNTVSNRIYNTINPYFQNSIGASELPTDPVYISGAYFLEIGRDV